MASGSDSVLRAPNNGSDVPNCDANFEIPSAYELLSDRSGTAIGVLVVACVLTAVSIVIFLERLIFVLRHYEHDGRKIKTICVLALFPVYSLLSFVGFLAPRATTLVDLVASIYLGVGLFCFLHLMMDYFGGFDLAKAQLKQTNVSLQTLPCCCLLFCLPKLHFSRRVYTTFYLLVVQAALVRPTLMFIAAVLWDDGHYSIGLISGHNGYIFIVVVNIASTWLALYGLMVLKGEYGRVLSEFSVTGKFICLQMLLLLSVILSLLLNILSAKGVIHCDDIFQSKSRGDRIYHLALICLMVPLSVIAKVNYRRVSDGYAVAGDYQQQVKDIESAQPGNHSNGKVVMTTTESEHPATKGQQQNGDGDVMSDYPMTVVDLDDHVTTPANSNTSASHTSRLNRVPSGQLDALTREV